MTFKDGWRYFWGAFRYCQEPAAIFGFLGAYFTFEFMRDVGLALVKWLMFGGAQ